MCESWAANRYPFEDDGLMSPRSAENAAVRLIRAYERVRHRPRTPECREAYHALAVAVIARGGWLQAIGLRYVWSRGEQALRRMVVRSVFQGADAPLKV